MALDGIFLNSIVNELKASIIDAKIDKINQPEKDEVILTLRKDRKNIRLLISASSKFPRIHITNIIKPNPIKAPMFTMVMRKYLLGGKITDISQINGDRILMIQIENTDDLGFFSKYILIIEIMGRHSNISLVRERDNKIMECIKHISSDVNSYRILHPGIEYVYPPISNKLNPFNFNKEEFITFSSEINLDENFFSKAFTGVGKFLSKALYEKLSQDNNTINLEIIFNFFKNFIENLNNNFVFTIYSTKGLYKDFHCIEFPEKISEYKIIKFNSPSELLEEYYYIKDKQDRLSSRSTALQKLINTNIERCNNKNKKLNSILAEAKNKEKYKVQGDLLTSYIYMLNKGMKEITLLNFFSEKTDDYITIELDENLSPSENIQKLYKKYNKLKKSEESALEQLEKNKEELDYLLSVLTNINNCDTYEEIDEIKKELIETGYLKSKGANKNAKNEKSSRAMHFISSEGIEIYVGKNNIQNEYLSLKFANKNHIWLHTKNIPGSHVILCTETPSDLSLKEAAIIAAYYSKGRDSSKIEIDYTKVKNLKKPNGAKPGMVIYYTNSSIIVRPQDFNNFKFEGNRIISCNQEIIDNN